MVSEGILVKILLYYASPCPGHPSTVRLSGARCTLNGHFPLRDHREEWSAFLLIIKLITLWRARERLAWAEAKELLGRKIDTIYYLSGTCSTSQQKRAAELLGLCSCSMKVVHGVGRVVHSRRLRTRCDWHVVGKPILWDSIWVTINATLAMNTTSDNSLTCMGDAANHWYLSNEILLLIAMGAI